MKKNFTITKFIALLSALLLLSLFGYQIYNYLFLTLHTDYAMEASMEDSFEVSGIALRCETEQKNFAGGYYDIIRETGDKVSGGGTIANVYAKASDVMAVERIRQIDALLDEYSAAYALKASYDGDSSNYDMQIRTSMNTYIKSVQNGAAQEALDQLRAFEKNVYIKQIVSGRTDSCYAQTVKALQEEKTGLQGSLGGNVQKIISDQSGYFCKSVDGYEKKLSPGALEKYSIEQFDTLYSELQNATRTDLQGAGKIISDYTWQFYFIAPQRIMKQYRVEKNLSLRFTAVGAKTFDATIITLHEDGENCLVGVQCDTLEPELLNDRLLSATVVLKTYSGIRIDKNSLRIVDDSHGVYVKVGSIIKFKKINILYTGTTYALIEKQNGGVENFDEIVVDGKDIYDGKIVS